MKEYPNRRNGEDGRAGPRIWRKVVLTGPSREYISLLRDAPALVARMRKLGLVRERGLHFKEESK